MELDTTNIGDYLDNLKFGINFVKVLRIEELSGGNSSYVFRVSAETPEGRMSLILKQAREFNKRLLRQNQHFKTSPKRIIRESYSLQKIAELTSRDLVPKVYYLDTENFVLIMEDAGEESFRLSDEFASDNLHKELSGQFGQFFAKLHSLTLGQEAEFDLPDDGGYSKNSKKYFQDRYAFACSKNDLGQVAAELYKLSETISHTLCWLDPVARNILLTGSKSFKLIDFEDVQFFDPAWDLGLFLSNLVIKYCEDIPQKKQDSIEFISSFLRQYRKIFLENSKNKEYLDKLVQRSMQYQGIYLLSRIDGESGSYFASQEELEKNIRVIASNLLSKKFDELPADLQESLII